MAELEDARRRTLELLVELDGGAWMGPRLDIVNPPGWEAGHVAWFQERWVLRHGREAGPLRPDADSLWDSARVPHETRWDLPLPDREATLVYLADVLGRVLSAKGGDEYFLWLALFHEDMHGEAFTYTRQTLAYRAPRPAAADPAHAAAGPWPGDVRVDGGDFLLGAIEGRERFVFDNEKWAHRVLLAPFQIARAPVTNADYAAFVEHGGYENRALWSEAGWRWRLAAGALCPVYWRRRGAAFEARRNDRTEPLAPHQPVMHVCWYEAEAYCRFAGRRLPSEAEWELAAGGPAKRRYPWGDDAPGEEHANLDGRLGGPAEVGAYPAGDSACGCRQMLGNTWEWTSSDFRPFPGFLVDPYKEYSEPWFSAPHKVLRGGAWATRARLLRATYRNFYPPHRRDVLAGFRTCALG